MTIQRGIRCPKCAEDIYSNSVHDFVTCQCGAVFIDGGFDYQRIGGRQYEEIMKVSRIVPPSGLPSRFRDERRVRLRSK